MTAPVLGFRVTHRTIAPPPRPQYRSAWSPTPEGCAACEWFQKAVSRCVHPRNGCPRGEHRREPWLHPFACPERLPKPVETGR